MRSFLIRGAAACALLVAGSAQAQVVGSTGGQTSGFATLTSTGLSIGSTQIATRSGGTVYTSDQPFADIPAGGVFNNTFLAAGPSSGSTATLSFVNPTSYLSFLWGSPDLYNVLTITTNKGTQTFTAAGLGFTTLNGDQTKSQYAQFQAAADTTINSVSFTNIPSVNAFETANFFVASPAPEPATWAMMIVGFGVAGASLRRRSKVQTSATFA